MDLRERLDDAVGGLRAALKGHQGTIWTATPAIIKSVDATKLTCTAQPATQARVLQTDGKLQDVDLPLLVDVPIMYPRGGGYTFTFPIKEGDECLVVFASRCIDNWWQHGGVQPQFEIRLHDLADGFAFVGPFSQSTKISNVSTTTTQMRSDDGTLYFEIDEPNKKLRAVSGTVTVDVDGNTNHVDVNADHVVVNASSDVVVTAPTVTINGNLQVSGTIHADGSITGGTVTLQTHRHGTVGTTAAATIVPTPGT